MMKNKDQSLTERAYREIKRGIIRCELGPGEQITEVQLSERFGIGRAGIRAALNRLYQERLVQVVPRQSYNVVPITIKSIRDMFGVRLLLEPAAAKMAAGNIVPAQVQHLKALYQVSSYRLGDGESAETFLRSNTEFHATVVRCSQNARLAEIVIGLLDDMERLFYLGLMHRDRNAEMYDEHFELIEAILAGDGERAERALADQIRSAEKMVLDALLLNPTLESIRLGPNPQS